MAVIVKKTGPAEVAHILLMARKYAAGINHWDSGDYFEGYLNGLLTAARYYLDWPGSFWDAMEDAEIAAMAAENEITFLFRRARERAASQRPAR